MTGGLPANIVNEARLQAESKALKSDEKQFFKIWQSGASPYSQKGIAFMNHKDIPYYPKARNWPNMTSLRPDGPFSA